MLDVPRSNLFAGMGLGKTPMVLSVLDLLLMSGSQFFPALVIAPKRVAQVVWTGEVKKWSQFEGISVVPIVGDLAAREAALRMPRADIYTINYENIPWLCERLGGKWPFRIVIADESTRLKSFRLRGGGIRATALSYIAQKTGRWVNLTGTPATNGLTDLWGQCWFLDYGGALGRTYTAFFDRWFIEDQYSRRTIMVPNAAEEIQQAIAPFTLSLITEECLPDLQKPQRVRVECELPKKARETYADMEKRFFVDIGEDGIEAPTSAVKSMKLLQIASGAIYDSESTWHEVHTAKIEALKELLDDINEPAMLSYHFNFTPERIKKAIPDAVIYRAEKDRLRFNEGKTRLILVHPQSAGHGLDFSTGSRNMIYFDHTWDLELRLQVFERLGPARQFQNGLNRKTRMFDLVSKDTMDEQALDRVDGKMSVQEALLRARSRRC